MLNHHSSINISHSSRSQSHSSSIMPLQQKLKANKKVQDKRTHLSPEQKTIILQNGTLIFQFLKHKLEIVSQISQCDTELSVQHCMSQQFINGVGEIEEMKDFVQRDVLDKLKDQAMQKATSTELNESIYSSLFELNQASSNLKEKISKLKQFQILTHRKNTSPVIQSQRSSSSKTNQHSRRTKIQNSTNYLSRVNSQQLPKVNSFDYLINIQEEYALNSQDQNESLIEDSLDSEKDKLQRTEQKDQKLKNYFYAFLISLSATETQYHSFLDSLYDELVFNSQFSPEKVQKAMMEDSQYCMRILILALTSKFQKMIKHSKFSQNPDIIYFPNDINFLKLTFQFILTNAQQMTDKIVSFCQKVRSISETIQDFNKFNNQEERQQNLKNTLSRYLPQNQQKQTKYKTISSRNLQILKKDMLRSCKLKHQLQPLSLNLLIFEKIILKICFDRISNCKRHNFNAAKTIFTIIRNSSTLNQVLHQSLQHVYEFSEQVKEYEKRQEQALRTFNKKFLKKILVGWKNIKDRKQKLLKILIKKKSKKEKKEQNLIFNRWRINISRKRIEQKMMAHSSSCTAIMNKFTEDEIQAFEHKKQKKSQSIEKSIHLKSEITVKRSNSFKNNFSDIRGINNSKTKISSININQKMSNNNDLRLLNYQYKQEILDKLNRQNRKNTQNKSKEISTKITRKTLLKV